MLGGTIFCFTCNNHVELFLNLGVTLNAENEKFFFLRDLLQFETSKTKRLLEWGLNERFETSIEAKVNSFTDTNKLSFFYN